MTFYKKIDCGITKEQQKKVLAGKPVALTAAQVKSGGSVSFHVHPENYAKIMRARRAGKGTRVHISPYAVQHDLEAMHGASVWSWLRDKAWPWVKKNWSGTIKPILSTAADVIAPHFGPEAVAVRGQVKNLLGIGVPKGGRLTKGSAEAKARMAAIRAKKKGGSFKL